MSRLQKKLIADKLAAAAKMADRNGDRLLSLCILNIASVYLYEREDLLKYVHKATISTLMIAKEEREFRRGVTPSHNVEGDKVDDALDLATLRATEADEEHLAGIIAHAHALRDTKRDDLMRQLFDIAESLSSPAVGRKPRKDITIFEDEGGDVPAS